MKRILTLAAAVIGFTFGANAQRQVNLSVSFTAPDGVTTNCKDSIQFTYSVLNNGPAAIYPTDTLIFLTPFADSGYINLTYGDTVLPNEYLVQRNAKVHPSAIKRLFDVNDGTYLFDPFANGQYGMAVEIIRFGLSAESTEISDTNPDDDGATQTITYNCTTGLKGLTKDNSTLSVYPNPANNQLSFTNQFTAATTASVRITDIAGRVVKTMDLGKQNAGSKTFQLDIADLNNGMYYLELVTETNRSISKFIKN